MTVKFTRIPGPEGTETPHETHDCGYTLQGLNLLGHAQLIDLFIGSECGGQGRCGKDRVRIAQQDRQHFNPPTDIERRHLGEARLADGWRLACQCYPARDGLEVTVEYGPLK